MPARPYRGAGLLFFRPDDGKVLLVKRSPQISYPGWWAIAGGSVEPGEDELTGALREATEELGQLPAFDLAAVEPSWNAPRPWWSFVTFLGILKPGQVWAPTLNWENSEWGWFQPVPDGLPQPIMMGAINAVRDLVVEPIGIRPS